MQGVARFFRSNIVEGRFFSLIAFFVVVAMRYALFNHVIISERLVESHSHVYGYIDYLFDNDFVSFIFSTISVIVIAWLLHHLNERYNITRSRTSLPFVVPLFLLSINPHFLIMSERYIAVIFILLAVYPLLDSYQKVEPYIYSFRSATLLGIASLFSVEALILLPLWWVGEFSMRGPQFKSFLASLFGVVLIYVSTLSVYLVFDNLSGFVAPFLFYTDISIYEMPKFGVADWVTVAMLLIFFVYSMIMGVRTYSRDKVLTLSLLQFFQVLTISTLILQVVYWHSTGFFITLALVFISFLNAYSYTRNVTKVGVISAYIIFAIFLVYYCSWFVVGMASSL
ncbi:MAG: hypothetical protein ACOYEA_03395 [Fermentimonas sp.]|jgi:hypothetical protein